MLIMPLHCGVVADGARSAVPILSIYLYVIYICILGGFADQNTYRRALIHAWACASAEGGESG